MLAQGKKTKPLCSGVSESKLHNVSLKQRFSNWAACATLSHLKSIDQSEAVLLICRPIRDHPPHQFTISTHLDILCTCVLHCAHCDVDAEISCSPISRTQSIDSRYKIRHYYYLYKYFLQNEIFTPSGHRNVTIINTKHTIWEQALQNIF